jgi:hypothetical protein
MAATSVCVAMVRGGALRAPPHHEVWEAKRGRLEGWPRIQSVPPWFETARFAALLTMRAEIYFASKIAL